MCFVLFSFSLSLSWLFVDYCSRLCVLHSSFDLGNTLLRRLHSIFKCRVLIKCINIINIHSHGM